MLTRNHPALGAFRKKKIRQADWEHIADELAHRLQVRITPNERCMCEDHLALRVYDAAKAQAHPLPKEYPHEEAAG